MFLLLVLLLPGFSLSVTYSQTDWSDNSGIYGPVEQWTDDFYLASNVDTDTQPGIILFDPICFEANLIAGGITEPKDVDVADIDDDGDLDVVSIQWNGYVTWWENASDSPDPWISHTIGAGQGGGNKVSCSDIDGDGDIDVVNAAYHLDSICWWENLDGFGEDWGYHLIATNFNGAIAFQILDMDSDNDMDVIGVAKNDHTIVYFENSNSVGTDWIPHTILNVNDPTCVCVYDVDQDGDNDLFVGHIQNDGIYLQENTSGGWITHDIMSFVQNPYDLCSGDIDNDGDIDLVCASYGNDVVFWYENKWIQQGTLPEHIVCADIDNPYTVHSFDLENDGDLDILCSALGEEVRVFENLDGLGSAWENQLVVSDYNDASSASPANIDDDLLPEIIAVSEGNDVMEWFELGDFQTIGYLESSVLFLGNDPAWGMFESSFSAEPGTSVRFQVRASDDFSNMGQWSDTLSTPFAMDSVLLTPGQSYFQYKVVFEIEESSLVMPFLNDISASWNVVDLVSYDSFDIEQTPLFALSENPLSQSSLGFHLTTEQSLEVSVFDSSGRRVISNPFCLFSPGEHRIPVDMLTPGVYHIVARSSQDRYVSRFTIIK